MGPAGMTMGYNDVMKNAPGLSLRLAVARGRSAAVRRTDAWLT
jgi:hypothetical protein